MGPRRCPRVFGQQPCRVARQPPRAAALFTSSNTSDETSTNAVGQRISRRRRYSGTVARASPNAECHVVLDELLEAEEIVEDVVDEDGYVISSSLSEDHDDA